jgi:hypothetical protein
VAAAALGVAVFVGSAEAGFGAALLGAAAAPVAAAGLSPPAWAHARGAASASAATIIIPRFDMREKYCAFRFTTTHDRYKRSMTTGASAQVAVLLVAVVVALNFSR